MSAALPPLAARLRSIAEARATRGPAHDFLHVLRVAASAQRIAEAEGARLDVVWRPRRSPSRRRTAADP
jgi:HD superfamily phosphodiesterase